MPWLRLQITLQILIAAAEQPDFNQSNSGLLIVRLVHIPVLFQGDLGVSHLQEVGNNL